MAGIRMALVAISTAALLTACDNGPSAVRSADNAETRSADTTLRAPAGEARSTAEVDRREEPVRLVDGKPMWSASRRYSAEENARRAFERNGEAFGARTVDQFVRKAHAFVDHPPAGTQTLTRANGDVLFYDPKSNVFAVTNRDGAPRTMFKPDDGRAYWEEQKSREASRQSARRSRDNDEA